MLSFNHYAYGAVIDWVYRNVAGLAPDPASPGYRRVIVAPLPGEGIDWATALIDTALGALAIAWRINEEGTLVVDLDVPFGATAEFTAPVTPGSTVTANGEPGESRLALEHGHHRIEVTLPSIAAAA